MWVSDGSRTRRFEAVALPQVAAAYSLARWICRNDADAADVVQEALLRAMQYFDSYRGDDARSWLLTIVRNTAHSWLKANRSMAQAHGDEGEWIASHPDFADPIVQITAAGVAESLRTAMGQLAVEHREVLILREFEELSYRQIAAVVGCPLGTVMSRLARARDQLAAIVRKAEQGLT